MKKNFRERTRDFFIKLGQKNSVLRVFAMIGLAASMLIFRFAEYCRTGGKRFACALFILCCFFTGNSFAYPVFYMDRGFISDEEPLLPDNILFSDNMTFLKKHPFFYIFDNLCDVMA